MPRLGAGRVAAVEVRTLVPSSYCQYDTGMSTARVTVSIPTETLASIERARRPLRKSRSAVVTEALAQWLRSRDVSDADRRYAEAYLRIPERAADTEATLTAAVAEWDRWE
jgi:metal-responsive CopG/Arc/MetJ family transcriptional regulator